MNSMSPVEIWHCWRSLFVPITVKQKHRNLFHNDSAASGVWHTISCSILFAYIFFSLVSVFKCVLWLKKKKGTSLTAHDPLHLMDVTHLIGFPDKWAPENMWLTCEASQACKTNVDHHQIRPQKTTFSAFLTLLVLREENPPYEWGSFSQNMVKHTLHVT